MSNSAQIAEWLSSLPHISEVRACTLTLAGRSYPAARYRRTSQTPEGSQAWQRGEREHTDDMIYAVGMLPSAYCRSTRLAFTMAGDAREWFIAAYAGILKAGKQAVVKRDEHHPFGNSIILSPWNVADSSIDQHEKTPYRRLSASVA